MTPGQQAILDGFTATLGEHGQAWTFGAASISGVITNLKPTDPRLRGLPDRTIIMLTVTTALPSPAPTVGDTMVKNSINYRISSSEPDEATGLTMLALALP